MEQIKALQEEGKLILIRIEGSASIEGSETYNLLLSNKRNESMKEYLVENGIKDDLITTSSKGNSEALVRDNAFEDIENTEPNPEDRYVKVYILFNE
jgi:outer membrane protein OmpA-like peptidoglycan-associated protein